LQFSHRTTTKTFSLNQVEEDICNLPMIIRNAFYHDDEHERHSRKKPHIAVAEFEIVAANLVDLQCCLGDSVFHDILITEF
jgi:hypothetical protein